MAYDVRWLVDDRVIYAHNYGIFTSDDLFSLYGEVDTMTDAGIGPVHLIVDSLDVERNQITIQDVRRIMGTKSEKSGWVIQVSDNSFERFVSSMANQLFQTRFKHVGTLKQALHVIAQLDETLENIEQHVAA